MRRDDPIARFVQRACAGRRGRDARCAVFTAGRDLPYATDGASDALTLLQVGRGDCLAKAALLLQAFRRLGYEARCVRWRYHLPAEPAEVALLPSRDDIHTAVDVLLDARWVLVDATHDPPLARGDLVVATWDGERPTPPAYPPQGPVWREGEDDVAIADALAASEAQYRNWWAAHQPAGGASYRQAFNAWLAAVRADEARHE